jgi:hypothetical protein
MNPLFEGPKKTWFDDPKILFDVNKVFEFWPVASQTSEERVNATSRFIIYASCLIYLLRRDVRIFVLGIMMLAILYIMYKSNMVKENMFRPSVADDIARGNCQAPTYDNPMANVLMSDYANPNRPPACYSESVSPLITKALNDTLPYDAGRSRSPLPSQQRASAARQFVSSPVTTIPGDQTGFAEWLYGPKFGPMCKSDGSTCSPDARGAQLSQFGGLDMIGNKRG